MARQFPFVILGIVTGAALTVGAVRLPVLATDAAARVSGKSGEYRALELFGAAFEQVRQNYVEVPDEKKLIENAINGMVAGLDNSFYLDGKAANRGRVCLSGSCSLAEIGIRFKIEDGLPKVITVIDDSPAAKAGLLTGDVITDVNDYSLDGLTAYQVLGRLDGEAGTTVKLGIARPGQDRPIHTSMVRDHITARSVYGDAEVGDIGYIRIVQFNENTAEELKNTINAIAAKIPPEKLKGYVVDLRNNPGGLLEGAVAATDAFLARGDVVGIGGRNASQAKRIHADGNSLSKGKPVVVLINGGSASTAEVVAAALQDNHRATLVGTRTFGAGSVATELQLGHGQGVLRLATRQYFTPAGRMIEGQGIAPDIEVAQDLPDNLKPKSRPPANKPVLQSYIPSDPSADKARNKAYALLRGANAN
jgi:carboxyl-terminal processing protease